MTKKDYELMANAIRDSKHYQKLGASNAEIARIDKHINDLILRLSYKLKADNSKFNQAKFIQACN